MTNRQYTVTVETIRAGQPRAYANSFYESLIHVSGRMFSDADIRALTSVLVHRWEIPPEEKGGFNSGTDRWYKPHLKEVKLEAEDRTAAPFTQTWRVLVVQAYLD